MGDKYYDKADIRRSGAEMGVLIGRQFLVAKFMTTEFYLGAGGFRKSQKEVFVSGEVPWPDREFVDVIFRPYLGWTFGFFFPW